MECGKVPFCCSCGLCDRHLHCSSSYLQGTSSSQASCTILGSYQPFNEGKGTDSLFEHIGHASIESSAIAECRVLNQGGTPIEDACDALASQAALPGKRLELNLEQCSRLTSSLFRDCRFDCHPCQFLPFQVFFILPAFFFHVNKTLHKLPFQKSLLD